MATWKDFTKGIVDFAEARVFPHRRSAGESGEGEISDIGQNQPFEPPYSDPLFAKIFGGFMEICDTLEAMKDTEVYIRQFPFSRSGIPRGRYLKFLIHAYLNEVYVLRERLLSYAKVLERLYRKDPKGAQLSEAAKRARSIVEKTLSDITRARGSHVHDARFSDERLDHFSGTELIARHAESDDLRPGDRRYAEWEYKQLRRGWRERIKENNIEIAKLLDTYAAFLYYILFDTTGRFVAPGVQRASIEPNSSAAPSANRALRDRRR